MGLRLSRARQNFRHDVRFAVGLNHVDIMKYGYSVEGAIRDLNNKIKLVRNLVSNTPGKIKGSYGQKFVSLCDKMIETNTKNLEAFMKASDNARKNIIE